ncbi:flagellar biosynthetic protein FliR [Aequitasia blattaphilus]|uniref:Flagellar biosynthetic protein FliR n=1 Tax=Aequitasia blattaphilus TaxID=2949332 RepID=A0ABT1EA18_9FIRM|nr:flagellar biosynthetic protein FliR [Aequitasia blattaphilus]MCP1102521.1 flagellar biosynthetic protein FliR [Aequitasia blattaphilus]MCR8615161.1 flagellar biosynthetic protein FliR [Aequitasia blattaphilus]
MLFSLVLMRMSGFIFLNPVLGRKDIPAYFKGAFAFVLAYCLYPTVTGEVPEVSGGIVYGILLLKEFAVGFVLGFVMQLFEMVVTYGGAIIDFQMGLSMSTVYDSQNGTQIALTGNILQIYYYLLFFAVDGHLMLIKIISDSSRVVPYGSISIGEEAAQAILMIFIQCIVLAVKLALPIIVFEFLMEIGVGILMRIVPQINVFVISMQLRIAMGILILLFMISPIGNYLNGVIDDMLRGLNDVLGMLAA